MSQQRPCRINVPTFDFVFLAEIAFFRLVVPVENLITGESIVAFYILMLKMFVLFVQLLLFIYSTYQYHTISQDHLWLKF